jgi:hypothetical protein
MPLTGGKSAAATNGYKVVTGQIRQRQRKRVSYCLLGAGFHDKKYYRRCFQAQRLG